MQPLTDLGKQDPHCTARYHGTESAYTYGCRCPHAKEDNRVTRKRRRQGRHISPLIDATGTQRRVQALCALGWSYSQLGHRLGWTWRHVQRLARKTNPTVHRRTADQIAALYRELCDQVGPSQQTRDRATAKRWQTPIAWNNIDDPNEQPQVDVGELAPDDQVDEIAVRRAMHGKLRFKQLRPADRVEAYRQLADGGASPAGIRERLRINGETFAQLVALSEAAAADTETRVAA